MWALVVERQGMTHGLLGGVIGVRLMLVPLCFLRFAVEWTVDRVEESSCSFGCSIQRQPTSQMCVL